MRIMPISTRSTNPDEPNEGCSTNPDQFMDALLPAPTPDQIAAARAATGANQTEAARVTGHSRQQTWSDWERGVKPMPALTWTWYLLATGQHPNVRLTGRR